MSGSAERHNPFHEFFEISEPGRVIIHTVFSGDGERESAPSARAPPAAPLEVPPPVVEEVPVHAANCDLCDSRIHGDRYVRFVQSSVFVQHLTFPSSEMSCLSRYARTLRPIVILLNLQ